MMGGKKRKSRSSSETTTTQGHNEGHKKIEILRRAKKLKHTKEPNLKDVYIGRKKGCWSTNSEEESRRGIET